MSGINSKRKTDYCGIYKITNKINNKIYIGQSQHCLDRWSQHKYCSKNPNDFRTYEHLYRSMRKYGIENFIFEIIEELPFDNQLLIQREQFWIDYYDTLNYQKGYNEVSAENAKRGENCNWAILTQEQVDIIYNLLTDLTLSIKDIADQFNVSSSCIEDINKGRSWVKENTQYPIRRNAKSIGHTWSTSNFTPEQIMTMRNRYVNETITQILKDFPQLTESGLKKILYGITYEFLPYYKKREKKWIYPDNNS